MKRVKDTNYYFVTEDGRVFSEARGELKERKLGVDTSGYKRISVVLKNGSSKRVLVHRMVAEAYVDNPNNHHYVNHKDGNKLNNHYKNLEWCTSSDNQKHAYKTSLKQYPKGQLNGRNRLSEQDVLNIYWELYNGARNIDVRNKYDIGCGTLTCIKNKRNWNYLLKDLPDIPIKPRAKKLSDRTIRWVCERLKDGWTAYEISDAASNKNLTPDRVWDIRARKSYKHISKDYTW